MTRTGSAAIELLDTGPVEANLAARVETKFVFQSDDPAALRAVLLRRGPRLEHAGPVSTVSSLYFDDANYGCCRANLEGVGLRHKTRLRWYDREMPGLGPVFFETKWRRHRLTGKRRTAFRSCEALETWTFPTILGHLRAVLPPERCDHLHRDDQAVALICYRREHFAVDGTDHRITLDHDIRFISQLGRSRLTAAFERRLNSIIVVEVKTAPEEGSAASRLLRPLSRHPGRFSKYLAACQAIGLARDL